MFNNVSYSVPSTKDPSKSRLHKALECFSSTVGSTWLQGIPLILVFTRINEFARLLRSTPLRKAFPNNNLTGNIYFFLLIVLHPETLSLRAACSFIYNLFVSKIHPNRLHYACFDNSPEGQVRFITRASREIAVIQYLRKQGIKVKN